MKQKGVKYTGIVSQDELQSAPGVPDLQRIENGPVAFIECVQEIPCNPCENSCPFGAITVGKSITNLPRIDGEKCIGCGVCIAACPGLAIFKIHKNYSETTALIDFPFEYVPLPSPGEIVPCANRAGQYIVDGKVLKIKNPEKYDGTAVLSVEIPKEYYQEVRTICIKRRIQDATIYICRCEEVTKEEIQEAINNGATTLNGIKKRTHAGMGLCQGRTCSKLITNMLKGIKDPAHIHSPTTRPPVRTPKIAEFLEEDE